jgi:hypothetical protein
MKKRVAILITVCGIFIFCYLIYKENAPEKIPQFQYKTISSPTTIASTNNYYDSDFNISLIYPREWLQVGEREFRGNDGYLKISELPDYHSFSADHVCSDYAYRNMEEKGLAFIHFGSRAGCMIFQTPFNMLKNGDTVFGILRNYSKNKYNYFLVESTYPHFKDIISSISFEKDYLPSGESTAPTQEIFGMSSNELSIKETFLKKAVFDGESWDLDKLYLSNQSPIDNPSGNCGKTIIVNNHELVTKQSHVENAGKELIEVLQDGRVIFSINIINGQSAFISIFCGWNGSWFLEASDFIVQDGEILNHKFGYDEMFGWHILDKKPFYFFTKDGSVFLSHDGQELPVKYDYVPHYRCCEVGSRQNPKGNTNKIWFLGARGGSWYSVEITANR